MARLQAPRVLVFGVGGVLLGATLGATGCDRGGEPKPTDEEKPVEPESPVAERATSEGDTSAPDDGGTTATTGDAVDDGTGEVNDDTSISEIPLPPATNVGREPKVVEPTPMPETNVGRELPPGPEPSE